MLLTFRNHLVYSTQRVVSLTRKQLLIPKTRSIQVQWWKRSLKLQAFFVTVTLGILVPRSLIAADSTAMSLAGRASVVATGDFTYSVPILVPPGTGGVVPSLSLNYSSGAGDGILGLGWSLGGLPSIVHCARTTADDAVHGSVNYDSNDRFCLLDSDTGARPEKQRLALVSGTYGADGSVYRTQIESFRKIIAHGVAGNGPSWFEVHLKSGQVLEFGNTPDSQILAVGKSTAKVWALNKYTDTLGNYLKVTYTDDAANGQ